MQKVGGLVHTRASMIVLWQRITSLVSPTGSESFSFFGHFVSASIQVSETEIPVVDSPKYLFAGTYRPPDVGQK